MHARDIDADTEAVAALLGVTDAAIASRLAAMDLGVEHRAALGRVSGAILANADRFVRVLYDRFGAEPDLAGFLLNDRRVESLRRSQRAYLEDLITAPIDRAYVLRRLKLGLVHHQVRLAPPWYLATYCHFVCDHVDLLFSAASSPAEAIEHLITVFKSVAFDAGLALQAYGYSEERALWTSHHSPTDGRVAGETTPPTDPVPVRHGSDVTRLHLDGDLVATRRHYLEIGEDDRRALAALEPTIVASASSVMSDFYGVFTRLPETRSLLPPGAVERLKRQVTSYWHEVARADFSRPYAASRMRIGVVHERINLPPHWYLAGLARQVAGLLRAMHGPAGALAAGVKALFKTLFFDVAFVIDAYMDARVEALLRTETYARRLVANMASAVAVLDGAGRIQSVNAAMLRMLAVDPALLYLMPAEHAFREPSIARLLDRSRASPEARIAEIVRFRGRAYRVTVMGLSGEGQPSGMAQRVLVLDDVNDLLDLATQVEDSMTELDAALDATRAVAWEMEVPEGTIVSISKTVLDVLGFRNVHFLGRSGEWLAAIDPSDRDAFVRDAEALVPGGRVEIEHRMQRADGTTIWVRSTLVKRARPTARPSIVGLTVDVTAMREEQQRRAEALLHAQRMEIVGRLAGGLSHDFNNTLTVIAANLELAQPLITDPQTADLVGRAIAAAEISAGLSRRLLSYTRQRRHSLQAVDVNERVAGLARLVVRALGDGIDLETRLAHGLPSVRLDPADLDSAILNLAINARDAMPGGGRIMMETSLAGGGDGPAAPGFVRLRVRDHGTGMTPGVRDRATDAFFSTKASPSSTGLGLYGVKRFVEELGGRLTIESDVGHGTTVSLDLPVVAPEAGRVSVPAPGAADVALGDGQLVLVVDGNGEVLRVTATMLEGLGYAVVTIADGRRALELLSSESTLDLLLVDAGVPGSATGVSLARLARAQRPTLPILLTSADPAMLDTADAVAEPMRMLHKPFTRARLAAAVAAALAD